jgi:hypothetical protein
MAAPHSHRISLICFTPSTDIPPELRQAGQLKRTVRGSQRPDFSGAAIAAGSCLAGNIAKVMRAVSPDFFAISVSYA